MNNKLLFFGLFLVLLIIVVTVIASDKPENTTDTVATKDDTIKNEKSSQNNNLKVDHHLNEAVIEKNGDSMTANLKALGLIPLKGESGAVGYGLITDKGTDAIIVSTTHGGVLDSETQDDANDPIWHNHIVKLGSVPQCGENPGVIDITFEEPGDVKINNTELAITDAPAVFSGTHSLTKEKLNFIPGTNLQKVVQFELEPIFGSDSNLQAVCVKNIEEVSFKSL